MSEKFGRLKVIKVVRKNKSYQKIVLCECDCGTMKEYLLYHIRSGSIKSCGCITNTHGMSKTRFYHIFKGIKQRCRNPRSHDYNRYGGRGIKCEWNDFISFRDDMYIKYEEHCKSHGEKNTSIERVDVDGNYIKSNCIWATNSIQGANRRNVIKYKGKSLSEWCRILDIKYSTARDRLTNRGKSIEEILGF